jgi:hypothetical protein
MEVTHEANQANNQTTLGQGVKMETGKEAEFILFENGDKVTTNKDRILVFEDIYMGDHSESWIVEKNRENGAETSRHNTRFIASIYWKTEDTPNMMIDKMAGQRVTGKIDTGEFPEDVKGKDKI